MKSYVCLSFIAAAIFLQVAEAAAVQNDDIDLGTASRLLLENFKRIMPCGLEALGIPPLAPVHVKKFEFNANSTDYNVSGQASDFFITDLENVEILAWEFNTTTKRFVFDVLLPQIQLLGAYKINDSANLAGFPVQLVGEGLLNNKFVDIRLVGDFTLSPVNKSQGVRITDYNFKFYVGNVVINNVNNYWGDVLNNFVNKFASEAIMVWNQLVQNRLNDYIGQYLLQDVNEILENVSEKAILEKMLDLNVLIELTNCPKA